MKTFNTTLIFALAGALTLSAASAEASNYGDKEAGYDGTVNTTVSGKTCHTWSEIAEVGPNKFDRMNTKWKATYNGASLPNHNFCRNPDSSERAWCYIKDATTTQVQAGEIAATWEYCNVDAAVAVSETPVANTFDNSAHYLKFEGGTKYDVVEITDCDTEEYQTQTPTPLSDRVCAPHSKPAPHQRIKTAGTAFADAVMENTCSDSEWYDNGNCKALTVCDATNVQVQAPSVTSDRVCGLTPQLVTYEYQAGSPRSNQPYVTDSKMVGNDGTVLDALYDNWAGVQTIEIYKLSGKVALKGLPKDTSWIIFRGGDLISFTAILWDYQPKQQGSAQPLFLRITDNPNFDMECPEKFAKHPSKREDSTPTSLNFLVKKNGTYSKFTCQPID